MTRLLNLREVAEICDVSTRTVRRLIRRGEFPEPRLVGRQFRWPPQDIEDFAGVEIEIEDETEAAIAG